MKEIFRNSGVWLKDHENEEVMVYDISNGCYMHS